MGFFRCGRPWGVPGGDGVLAGTVVIVPKTWPCLRHSLHVISDYRCPIEIGGVRTDPGDIIFGDLDGRPIDRIYQHIST
ncbi:MAG: hypothetical protein AVDCRST_MAG43-2278 [uncultured Thermomicrobiales bacterium]|uniref:Uncharacterized protein n=1 Tax=uncultured Thermomicrobiales bacterium TaxID=1645740 RepID=A0A6J4UZS1_9BACT|nr:MAG: hypothetical protein AVDCRST_MAG43-2278 [uncultured Thermomicrobiales bacterium]